MKGHAVDNVVRKAPKSIVGRVVSNKMQKTVVVEVAWTIIHPEYKKVVRRTTRYMAHDEHGCAMGDRVKLAETRPLSKRKRWQVISIVERSQPALPSVGASVAP
ncbi:MAG: 30S ribosomal protein S17 [Nitrospiria bacterium]